MPKVITDVKQVDEFLERGVAEVYPSKQELKTRMLTGKPMKVYCGFDPSAPSLHIGNAVLIKKLGDLQRLGHEVIFLIGDFTGMIGDPTDKTAARKKLTREEVLENAKSYKEQASGYLEFEGDNPARVKYNSQWSDPMTFKELIEISSNFTVQRMVQRDMFQQRFQDEKPVYLHEFLYPLAQGYDSVAMEVDLEIGGNDQMFNMLCGRDLEKAMIGKEKFVLTMKLLADPNGKKMGKSEGNAVFLDQSAEDMYGAIMAWPDGVIPVAYEMCTQVEYDEVKSIAQQLKDPAVNPRDLKMRLAYEITKINKGDKAADQAQEYFVKTIQHKEVPDEVKPVNVSAGERLVEVMAKSGLAESNADARRKIEQGGVRIDGQVVDDIQLVLDEKDNKKIIKVGKREFRKICF